MPRKLPRKATDGAAIDDPFGARGDDPRKYHNARVKAEEGEEDEARSPTRRRRTKTTRNGGLRAEVAASRRRFSVRAHGWEQKRGEGNWGGEGGARLSTHFLSERGVEERIVGERGAAWRFEPREKGGKQAAAVGEGDADRQTRPVSGGERERERERREGAGWLAGPRPRKRGGVRGFWAKMAEKKEKRENSISFYIFLYQISN